MTCDCVACDFDDFSFAFSRDIVGSFNGYRPSGLDQGSYEGSPHRDCGCNETQGPTDIGHHELSNKTKNYCPIYKLIIVIAINDHGSTFRNILPPDHCHVSEEQPH